MCGPLTRLAESIIDGTAQGTTSMGSSGDVLCTYVAATGIKIEYVVFPGYRRRLEDYP